MEFLRQSEEFGPYFLSAENTVGGLRKRGRVFTSCRLLRNGRSCTCVGRSDTVMILIPPEPPVSVSEWKGVLYVQTGNSKCIPTL